MKTSLIIFFNVQISIVRIISTLLFLKSCFQYTAVLLELFEFVLVDLFQMLHLSHIFEKCYFFFAQRCLSHHSVYMKVNYSYSIRKATFSSFQECAGFLFIYFRFVIMFSPKEKKIKCLEVIIIQFPLMMNNVSLDDCNLLTDLTKRKFHFKYAVKITRR